MFKCKHRGFSKIACEWLENLAKKDGIVIQHALNDGEVKIDGHKRDGYCKERDMVYEFFGCFFHGCQVCFSPEAFNELLKKPMIELYQTTMDLQTRLQARGPLTFIWEHEYRLQLRTT